MALIPQTSATQTALQQQLTSIQWRCSTCEKLLGIRRGSRVHISFSRGHEYLVGLPASATCRDCHTLNELAEMSLPERRSHLHP
jgi:hypothetical protein